MLPRIGKLEYLELWMVRGLADLTPVAAIPTLRYLRLQALKNVERLPNLANSPELATVWLEAMKGLTDLTPLLSAPALRQVTVYAMRQLAPSDIAVLGTHPQLRHLRAAMSSKRAEAELRRLVPLSRDGDFRRPADLFPN